MTRNLSFEVMLFSDVAHNENNTTFHHRCCYTPVHSISVMASSDAEIELTSNDLEALLYASLVNKNAADLVNYETTTRISYSLVQR